MGISSFILAFSSFAAPPRSHKLVLVHPGDPKEQALPYDLTQTFDTTGEPAEYFMWVDSVICRDETCDVVAVKLVWDALGRYQRYELAKGDKLTKLDHEPFSPADHAKLQRILKDQESPLREVTKEGLTGPKKTAGVDGVAGATVLTLANNVVIGAGYTCYDLWHWANGEMADRIRTLTGKTCSPEQLLTYLANTDNHARNFAIAQLTVRKLADSATRTAVIAATAGGDKEVMAAALTYFNAVATPADRFAAILDLFANASGDQRVLILETLAADTATPPPTFYPALASHLPTLDAHHEVHLLLQLLDKRKAVTPAVLDHVVTLLKHDKFFIARRAFWFLDERDLSAPHRQRVDAFYDQHQDRL